MNFHPIIPPFYYATERERESIKCLRRAFQLLWCCWGCCTKMREKEIYFVNGACALGTLRAYSNESHVRTTLIYLNCEYKLSWHRREESSTYKYSFFIFNLPTSNRRSHSTSTVYWCVRLENELLARTQVHPSNLIFLSLLLPSRFSSSDAVARISR